MSVRAGAGTLAQAMKELSLKWQQTRAHWRDAKAEEFEARIMNVLPDHVSKALEAMEDLEKMLRKVRSDCE